MTDTGLLALVHNAALLLSMVLMFEMLVRQGWKRGGLFIRILVGVLLGSIGIAVMLTRWELLPGLVLDTRSILLAISGLFFGGVPTLVAMAMTGGLRLFQGGVGAMLGVAVILVSGLLGLGWRRWLDLRHRSLAELSLGEAYAFGLVVHTIMLLLFVLILPLPMALEMLARIGLPVLAIYPTATLLLSVLMVGNLRKSQADASARDAQAETMRLLAQAESAKRVLQRVIKDERAARLALNKSETRYRAVFNQQFQYMAILSPDGTTLDINKLPRCIQDCAREDFVGKPFWDSVAWRDLPEWQGVWPCRLAEAADADGPLLTEDSYRVADGGVRHLDSATTAIRDAAGHLLFFLVQASDITERRVAEQERDRLLRDIQSLNEALEQRVIERTAELKLANRELESFTSSVSHDLRAPLRAINGFARILARRCHRDRLDADGRHYLDNVVEAGQRMETLVEDLLKYSRTGQGAVRAQPVALAPIVAELNAIFGERIAAVGAIVQVREPLATPLGDPTLIGQILKNLLDNALLYHCREGHPRIDLEARREGERVVILVSDNGIGIDPNDHEKIFRIFQRLHGQEDYPGTGIGLAIVVKATQFMGGEIGVESIPGQGSRFKVSLPAGAEGSCD